MTGPLILSASTENRKYKSGAHMPVRLRLHNTSSRPIWVNRRLGVGYEDAVEREIYFTVYTQDGVLLPVPDESRVDVHRTRPERKDFVELEPGAAIETTVDLAMWYPFARPGTYRIDFIYENRTDGKEFGLTAFVGRVSSAPIYVVIEP